MNHKEKKIATQSKDHRSIASTWLHMSSLYKAIPAWEETSKLAQGEASWKKLKILANIQRKGKDRLETEK